MTQYLRLERSKPFKIVFDNYPAISALLEQSWDAAAALKELREEKNPDAAKIKKCEVLRDKKRDEAEALIRLELADVAMNNRLSIDNHHWFRLRDGTKLYAATIHIEYPDKTLRDHVHDVIAKQEGG